MGEDDADRYQEELNDAVEAGGCTEIWEKISERREDDEPADQGE